MQLLSPVVLALHNAEEFARYEEFTRVFPLRLVSEFGSRDVVRNALGLSVTGVGALSGLAFVWPGSFAARAARVTVFALFWNSVGHCVLSLKGRAWTPGSFSAVFLVLPYSAICIGLMRRESEASIRRFGLYALLGFVAGPVAIALFLSVGYWVS